LQPLNHFRRQGGGKKDKPEAGDSRTVYLVCGSVLSLSFVEPNRPDPRHVPQTGFGTGSFPEIQNVPVFLPQLVKG